MARLSLEETNMNTRRHFISFLSLLTSTFIMIGCAGDSIISALQAGLDIITSFLPTLSGITGLPTGLLQSVDSYISAVNSALGQSSAILLGGGTDAEKVALITQVFAGIISQQPAVPPQYAAIATVISNLAAAVAKFLATLPPATSAGIAITKNVGNSAQDLGHTTRVWNNRQKLALAHAQSVSASNSLVLNSLIKK